MVHLWCVYIWSTYCSIVSCLFVLIYTHIYVHTLTHIPSLSIHIYTCSDIHRDANTFHFPTRLRANTISHSLASTFARSHSISMSLYHFCFCPHSPAVPHSLYPSISLSSLSLPSHCLARNSLSLPSHSLPRNSLSLPSHSFPRNCEGNVSE